MTQRSERLRSTACGQLGRRAALLLEVVIALAVLVAAVGLLGGQLVGGLRMTGYAEEQLRAELLTERVLGMVQLDPNTQRRIAEAEETAVEDVVGDDYPGYFWRVQKLPIEPDDETLFRVTLEVLRQDDPDRLDSINGAQVVRRLAFLQAPTTKIDMESLGLTPDVLGQLGGAGGDLASMLPLLTGLLGGDAGGIDIQQLLSTIDPGTLATILPMIQSLASQVGADGQLPFDPSQLGGLVPGGGFFGGDAGIQGHILGLERRYPVAFLGKNTAQRRHQDGFAGIRMGAEDH